MKILMKMRNWGWVLICFLAMTQPVLAGPQHARMGGGHRMETQQRNQEAMRAQRQAERQAQRQTERQQARQAAPEKNTNQGEGAINKSGAENQTKIERPNGAGRFNQLTPEERRALRKQIRETGAAVYERK